jgi:hypothetical protein
MGRQAAAAADRHGKAPRGREGRPPRGAKKDERPGGGRADRRRSKARINSGRPWRSQMSPQPRGEEEIASSPIVTYYDTVESRPTRGWKLVMDRDTGPSFERHFRVQRGRLECGMGWLPR